MIYASNNLINKLQRSEIWNLRKQKNSKYI